jgi:hypothetical protein
VSAVRWLLRIGIVLALILAIVVVAGEVVLRPIVERRVASDIARRYALTETPSVSLRGGPFVVRAIQGRLDGASIGVTDYEARGLRLAEAQLDADDVRFSLGPVLRGDPDVTADRVEARVTVTDADFSSYLAERGLDLAVRVTPGVATASGSVDVGGVTASGVASGSLTLAAGTLRFVPSRVDLTGGGPAGADLQGAFAFDLPVPEVAGVRVTGVQLGDGEATFTADVTDYALAGGRAPLRAG